MTRDEFRQQMELYRQAREQNPQLSYWKWKGNQRQFNSQDYKTDELPVKSNPDVTNEQSEQLRPLDSRRYEQTYYDNFNDSPYEDVRIEDRAKPRFELRKEQINYYSKPFINTFKNVGKVLRVLGPASTFIENTFPSEDAEILDNLRTKMKESENRINGYSDGTDGIQSNTSEIPVTYSNGKWNYGYNPGAGFLKPVVSIQDAADLTPVGNAIMANDVYQSASQGDYITAGLIGAAALLPGAISKPLRKIVREIPSVNPKYFSDKINKVLGREVRPNGLSRDVYTDAINQRNRVIEDLYTDQDYWDRARAINEQYGDDYTKVYKGVLDTYENKYTGLPEPKAKHFFGDAKAEMAARKDAMERFRMNKIPAGYTDFEYNISPHLDRIDRPTAQHELGHYVDFNLSQNANADYNNNMFSALRRDLSADNNPLYPDKTDYFRQGTEQKPYMNTLRSYMQSIGLMDRPGQKVTTKTIKRAINSLPSEMNAVRAAYLQFDSPGKYTKWFNKIPLLSIPGAAMYFENNNESN